MKWIFNKIAGTLLSHYHILSHVEICLKNYYKKLSYTEPRDNLVLISKLLESIIKLSYGLILF